MSLKLTGNKYNPLKHLIWSIFIIEGIVLPACYYSVSLKCCPLTFPSRTIQQTWIGRAEGPAKREFLLWWRKRDLTWLVNNVQTSDSGSWYRHTFTVWHSGSVATGHHSLVWISASSLSTEFLLLTFIFSPSKQKMLNHILIVWGCSNLTQQSLKTNDPPGLQTSDEKLLK